MKSIVTFCYPHLAQSDHGTKTGKLCNRSVESVDENKITTKLDGREVTLTIPTDSYQAFDHGYATTIHKSQGATVDQAFVMVSTTMDRHLTYVSMTRHKDDVKLYATKEEFTDRNAGVLVLHGSAPYLHDEGNKDSYFVTTRSDNGREQTIWGVDLKRAIEEAGSAIGDQISLRQMGSETVQLPNGQTAERNNWDFRDLNESAFDNLKDRLSRSGTKETTLDYIPVFAANRGIGDGSDQDIKIDLAPDADLKNSQSDYLNDIPAPHIMDQRQNTALEASESPLPSTMADEPTKPKRGMFDGLTLSARSHSEFKPMSKLKSNDRSVQESQTRLEDHLKPQSEFERALGQYAQIHSDIEDQKNDSVALLPIFGPALNRISDVSSWWRAGYAI